MTLDVVTRGIRNGSNVLRIVEGPDGRRRLAHCGSVTQGFGLDYRRLAFLKWVDGRFLGRAVENEKHRQSQPDRIGKVALMPSVPSIKYNDPSFVVRKPGTSIAEGAAADHPAMKAWIEDTTPSFVEETVDPSTGDVTGGGVSYPDDFNQVDSNKLDVGP